MQLLMRQFCTKIESNNMVVVRNVLLWWR